jgi:hypothetical protein
MPLNNLITFRKGTESEWNNANPILDNGEPGWDVSNNIFKIGDGVHPWNQLGSLNSKTVKGSFLLNEPSGSFVVAEGYNVGSLDIFLNGVKLSPSGDYVANDGTSFTLTDLAPSGSIVEYLGLYNGAPPSVSGIISELLPSLVPASVQEYEIITSTKSSFAVAGGYENNILDVYHNGIKLLINEDYVPVSGNSFTLLNPAVSGDVVEWQGLSVIPKHQILLGEVRSDYIANTNYLGTAPANSSEASSVWRIKKYVIADNGIDITVTTAVNAVWNNRLTETYF